MSALDDIENAMQQHAQAADAGVTLLLQRLEQQGGAPIAMASGALFAVVRYHLKLMGEPRTHRALLATVIPAISKAAKELLQN